MMLAAEGGHDAVSDEFVDDAVLLHDLLYDEFEEAILPLTTTLQHPGNLGYIPNSASIVGIIGDLSRYIVADALDMQVQVLDQLYAESNQTGYIARMETDGMPTLENAFVRVKLA